MRVYKKTPIFLCVLPISPRIFVETSNHLQVVMYSACALKWGIGRLLKVIIHKVSRTWSVWSAYYEADQACRKFSVTKYCCRWSQLSGSGFRLKIHWVFTEIESIQHKLYAKSERIIGLSRKINHSCNPHIKACMLSGFVWVQGAQLYKSILYTQLWW